MGIPLAAVALAWRIAVLAVLLGGVVASDSVGAEASSSKGSGFAILYTSNWEGSDRVFAVDPAGQGPVGQVTFARPFTADYNPLPSPDGRHLLFYTGTDPSPPSALWLSRADGSASRVIATGAWPATWSPDSSRFAYLAYCCLNKFGSSTRRALHVARADGSSDRIVGSTSIAYIAGVGVIWSADSRHVHAASVDDRVTPSPDGRWRATGSALYRADGSLVQVLGSSIDEAAWSPDSRYLAYEGSSVSDQGIHVLDVSTRTTRLWSRDAGCFLAWSPDGRVLAYLHDIQGGCRGVGDLRAVTRDGHVRVVVAAGGPYRPSRSSIAWTRVPTGVRYRAPSLVTGVYTGSPVTALAAEGSRVAYGTCAGVFTWDVAAARATEVASTIMTNGRPASDNCVYGSAWVWHVAIALAGDRLAYVDGDGGNQDDWSVRAVSLGTTPYATTVLASGSNTNGIPEPEVAGSGGLLALATRDYKGPYLVWHIQTVGPSGCPCGEILNFQAPKSDWSSHLDGVDAGRLVVNGGGFVRVLDGNGTPLLVLPLQAEEAALSGDDLVVHVGEELRNYSASTGTLLHTWPMAKTQPRLRALQDVAHGLAAYVVDDELHLLRLSDGSDTVVGPGKLARFAADGLVDAVGARVQLIPYSNLPLH